MPDASTPENDQPQAEPEQAAAEDAEPAAEGEPEEQPAFANRAERRAHGKGTTQSQLPGKDVHFGRRGTVQGPRQWGNRRSG
jgi:hypothetical protein